MKGLPISRLAIDAMKACVLLAALLVGNHLAAAGAPRDNMLATVYPSGHSIPEDLLRIELRFPHVLNATIDMHNVRLLDADGAEIEGAFLDLPLWSSDRSRIAFLLHPARVKSGVGPNVALGRALHAGSEVSLVVDDPQLGRAIRKTWSVESAMKQPPDPDRWSFQVPPARGRLPLVVRLNDAVSSSATELIAVRAPDGSRVRGSASLLQGETVWRFVPAQPWRSGSYALVTHPDLEDPAGNRACARFEQVAASRAVCAQGTARSFRVEAHSPSNAGESHEYSIHQRD